VTRKINDDATDRQLLLLVGLAVVGGLINLAWLLDRISRESRSVGLYPVVIIALCAAAISTNFPMRIGANNLNISVSSSAALVAVVVLPPEWAGLCAGTGALIWTIALRIKPLKMAFNVAKATLAASAAAAVVSAFGVVPAEPLTLTGSFAQRAVAMFTAAIAYAIVDEGLLFPTLAVATRTSIRQRFLSHWDVRLLSRLGAFAVAVAATFVVQTDRWLLLAMPVLLYMLYLLSAGRVRSREEREAWQRLARTTDELNDVDLDGVLHSAVRRAAELFSADEVEILVQPLNNAPARLVRGSTEAIIFDGRPEDASTARGVVIPAVLESHDGEAEVGELRLRFRGKVQLSERETYTLRTFAAALCTAIRNASAYAEAQRLAESHALNASLDPLTGLANRRKLQEYGAEVLAHRAARGVHPAGGRPHHVRGELVRSGGAQRAGDRPGAPRSRRRHPALGRTGQPRPGRRPGRAAVRRRRGAGRLARRLRRGRPRARPAGGARLRPQAAGRDRRGAPMSERVEAQ